MIKNSYKLCFLLMTMMGTLLIMSSNSWFNIWLGLEVNLMSFIALIINNKNSLTIESSLIYFLIQSIASIILLYSIIINLLMNNKYLMLLYMITMIMMIMKIGSAPFHFWLPLIMEGLNWMNNYLLMTWQKLGPLIIMTYLNNMYIYLNIFIIMSIITSSMLGLNQTSMKKIMAYSSINQISWILYSMMLMNLIWKIYLSFYFFITLSTIMIFIIYKINKINQILLMKKKLFNFIIMMNIMSMMGLPPFLGFFPKLLIMFYLNNNMMMFLMIMFTLLMMFFYLRINYSILLLNNIKLNNKLLNFKNNKNLFKLIMIISLITNIWLMMLLMMF